MAASRDWQASLKNIPERIQYIKESGELTDCRFIVGIEPNRHELKAHKLVLAISSPVFYAMFFGALAETDPIVITDVQPDIFKALLKYMYTDKIELNSVDQACDLYYAAEKYMLPYAVEQCMKYICSNLHPRNACRAYEFAKLFQKSELMDKSIQIIKEHTREVLSEKSFDNVELSTIVFVFSQPVLNIDSELDLFEALERYVIKQKARTNEDKASTSSDSKPTSPTISDALKLIRFLTVTPEHFINGPGHSNLLQPVEKYSLLINISIQASEIPVPKGFSDSKKERIVPPSTAMSMHPKRYCVREILEKSQIVNRSAKYFSVTFVVNKNICVHGIQVPTQMPRNMDDEEYSRFLQQPQLLRLKYTELLYAHLLSTSGTKLTHTYFTSRVNYSTMMDIYFKRPIIIQKDKQYTIGLILTKIGLYPVGTYSSQMECDSVKFNFLYSNSINQELIKSIIFTV